MPYLVVHHKVADFDQWHRVFSADPDALEAAGLVDGRVMRDHRDPNLVTVMFRIESISKAREFTDAPEAHQAAKDSGVIGDPEVLWLEEL